MGGTALLKDLAEAAPRYLTSTENILEKSAVGKSVVEFLKNEFEPAVGKEAKALLGQPTGQPGVVHNAETAWKAAKEKISDLSFGRSKQGLIPLLQTAQRQAGPAHAAEVADAMNVYLHDATPYWRDAARKQGVQISRDTAYKFQGPIERGFKAVSAPAFLPRISIPHASQAPLNSLLVDGWKATARAFADFATNPRAAYDLSLQAGAQSQELMHEFINATRGTSTFRLLVDPLRKVFNLERKWGIAFSAVSGKWAAIDAASEYATKQSKWAELQLKVLGLDPQAILEQGGVLRQDDIEQAAFRSASEVMGFRSPLETPYKWEFNWASRVANLYKHYGFRQARLIKESLVRAKAAEGWTGVAKITATLGSTFFIAGEAIKAVEDAISLKQPWSKDEEKDNFMGSEYLDGIAHAGGFGIIYSTLRGAKHNHLLGYLAGPVISSATDIAQDALNMRGRSLARDIGRKFGLPGTAAVNLVLPAKKKKEGSYY